MKVFIPKRGKTRPGNKPFMLTVELTPLFGLVELRLASKYV